MSVLVIFSKMIALLIEYLLKIYGAILTIELILRLFIWIMATHNAPIKLGIQTNEAMELDNGTSADTVIGGCL